MSSRLSSYPMCYASIDDLQRALLVQMRRFNRACSETSAAISLTSGPKQRLPAVTMTRKDASALERLELLRAQIKLLKNMSGQLLSTFGADPRAVAIRRQVDDLTADMVTRVNSMQREISDAARSRVDTKVIRAANTLSRELQEDLKLSEDQVATQFFVAEVPAAKTPGKMVTAELLYIRLQRVKDADGYSNPSVVIAVAFPGTYAGKEVGPALHTTTRVSTRTTPEGETRQIGGKELQQIYVSVSTEFKVPTKLRWDAVVKSTAELKSVVRSLLEADNIIGSSSKRDIPVPRESVNLVHDNVKSTRVSGNVVEVRVVDPKKIRQTEADLLSQLQSIVRAVNPGNRDVIRSKVMVDAGLIRFVFSLPGNLRGRVIPHKALEIIRKDLNLDDAQLQRVRSAIEDPE